MQQDITTSPTPLSGLTDDVRYTVQNQSGRSIYIQVSTTVPTDVSQSFRMESAGELSYGVAVKSSGEEVYVWGLANGGSVVFDEAV